MENKTIFDLMNYYARNGVRVTFESVEGMMNAFKVTMTRRGASVSKFIMAPTDRQLKKDMEFLYKLLIEESRKEVHPVTGDRYDPRYIRFSNLPSKATADSIILNKWVEGSMTTEQTKLCIADNNGLDYISDLQFLYTVKKLGYWPFNRDLADSLESKLKTLLKEAGY